MYLHFQEILGLPWYSIYRHLFFLVYKIDFTIVQLLSIVYFIGQESITETTAYFMNKLVTVISEN